MDIEPIDAKERVSDGRGEHYGQVFEIREFDLVTDSSRFMPIFWQAWLAVHGQDRSNPTHITIAGEAYNVPEIEALLYWYLHDERSSIRLCLEKNEIIGFVIYNKVFDGTFSIRLIYIRPDLQAKKVARDLVSSIPNVKAILFQTKKEIEPKLLFKAVGLRPEKIFEDSLTVTYSMTWGE